MMYNPNVIDRTQPTLPLIRAPWGVSKEFILWIKNHFEPIEDEV